MSEEIIPFGKYKGKPLEILQSDFQYSLWLSNQDWFREKYSQLLKYIESSFQLSEDTPEHNRMQLRWMKKDYLNRLIIARYCSLNEIRDDEEEEDLAEISEVVPEKEGWDIYFKWDSDEIINNYVELKPTIGDDYPSILRAMNGRRANHKGKNDYYLVAASVTSTTADVDRLYDYFESAGYLFYTEAELKVFPPAE